MRVPGAWFRDRVAVRTLTGVGGAGEIHADPVEVRGAVDATRKVVRDSAGNDVVCEVTVLLRSRVRSFDAWHDTVGLFSLGSLVDAGGVEGARVAVVKEHKSMGRVVYVEANLT